MTLLLRLTAVVCTMVLWTGPVCLAQPFSISAFASPSVAPGAPASDSLATDWLAADPPDADSVVAETASTGPFAAAGRADCPAPCAPVPERLAYTEVPGHVSLRHWARERRLLLFDRSHSIGDAFYDRGVFRHITPLMDREYALDMMVYQFSPFEDYRWQNAAGGLRMRAGSVERSLWAFVTDIRNTVDLGGPNTLTLNARLQEDGQGNRSLLEIGYAHAFSARHHVGVRHTFSRNKVDFDVSGFYRFADPTLGEIEVELTAENAYNNFITQTLGVDAEDEDVLREYVGTPFVGQVHVQTPMRYRWHAEVHAGWRPDVTAQFVSQTREDFRYTDREGAHYLGAVVDYQFVRAAWGEVVAGLLYQRDRAELARTGTGPAVSSDYRTVQRFWSLGGFARARYGPLRGELYYAAEDYTDIQSGTDFSNATVDQPLDYFEDRRTARIRGFYEPDHWPFLGLEYAAFVRALDKREDTILTRQWTNEFFWTGPSNYRLNLLIGYRWARGSVAGGVGFDTDNDELPEGIPQSPGRFDNAHFRLTLVW